MTRGFIDLLTVLAAGMVGCLGYGQLFRAARPAAGVGLGNRWLRLALLAAATWYAVLLLRRAGGVLGIGAGRASALDLLGAASWAVLYPAAVAGAAAVRAAPRAGRALAVLSLFPLAPLATSAVRTALGAGTLSLPALAEAAAPWPAVHAGLGGVLAAGLLLAAGKKTRTPTGRRFVGRLAAAVLAAGLGTAAALSLAHPGPRDASAGGPLPAAAHLPGLLPAVVVLASAYRDASLRLPVRPRSLRHGVNGLLVFAGIALGSAWVLGMGRGAERIAAAAAVATATVGLLYRPARNALTRRFPQLAPLADPAVSASEARPLALVAAALGDRPEAFAETLQSWLSERFRRRAAWVTNEPAFGSRRELWRLLAHSGRRRLTIDEGTAEGADLLAAAGCLAAFPVRRDGAMEAMVLVRGGPAPREGEWDALELVLARVETAMALGRAARESIEAQRRAMESERLAVLGGVAAALAHELRNPLGAIQTLVSTAGEEISAALPGSAAGADLEEVTRQIRRLDTVSREILAFARPTSGSSTDLDQLVRGALRLAHAEARRRRVSLDTGGVMPVGPVPGSPGTWQIVVFNLLTNAVRHTPPGETARVLLGTHGGWVRFATSNPAPPIDGDPERLAEPFVSSGGTGLGLALVRQRAEALGGRLALSAGDGTLTVEVRVPLDPSVERGGAE